MMTSFGFKKSPWLFLIFALNMVCLLADDTTENELDSSLTTGDSITNTTSQILVTAEFDTNSTIPGDFGDLTQTSTVPSQNVIIRTGLEGIMLNFSQI